MCWEFTERAQKIAWGIKGQWENSQFPSICGIVIQLWVISTNRFLSFLSLFPAVLSTKLITELWFRIRNCRYLTHDLLTSSVHSGPTSNWQYSHSFGFWIYLIHYFCKLDTPRVGVPEGPVSTREQMEVCLSSAPRPSGEMILNQMFYIACQTPVPHQTKPFIHTIPGVAVNTSLSVSLQFHFHIPLFPGALPPKHSALQYLAQDLLLGKSKLK